jgi:HD-GYP domain-containing protein (c-di-GMP phosphodiesterase class II)
LIINDLLVQLELIIKESANLLDNLKKLEEKDMQVGQALAWSIYDSNGTMLIKAGFVLSSKMQVEKLIKRGCYIKLVTDTTEVLPEATEAATKEKDVSPFKLIEDVCSQLTVTLASIEVKKYPFSDEILELSDKIQLACERDAHASLASLFVLQGNSYPIKHCVDVAVLAEIMGRAKRYTKSMRQSLVAAALTMNVSMLSLQEELYRQATPLTEEQKAQIHAHPKRSVMMLQAAGVSDRFWLKCVLAHHETIQGTGYPNKLTQEQFPEAVQLLSLADNYCARMSPRAYRDPLLHKSILRDILLEGDAKVSPDMAQLFIKQLGFYPPGMLVQLMNAEVGVVTKRGEKPNEPTVHVCMRPQTGNYNAPIARNTQMNAYRIKRILQANDPDVTFDPRAVWKFDES